MFKIKTNIKYPKLPTDLSMFIEKALLKGMFKAERISKKDYLTGPRPQKLGVVTGRLRSSITTQVTKKGKKFIGLIGTNVVYGRRHELGDDTMPKRPFLRPALVDALPFLEKEVNKAISEAWGK